MALVLGLLVGLQRQRTEATLAGFRTFPLATVLGASCGLLASLHGGVVLALGLASLATLAVAGNLVLARTGQPDPGITTEVALLVMFGVGALAAQGYLPLVAVLGGGTALLLYLKEPLHGFAGRLSDQDTRAIMQFVLVSLVILPMTPDRAYGPYSVLNPRQVWWMVVLMVSVSLLGYVSYRLVGARRGTLLTGLLGGMVSSTATTASYARRSVENRRGQAVLAGVVVIAGGVVFIRMLVEIAVVAPSHWFAMAVPFVVMLLVLLLGAAWLQRSMADVELEVVEPRNPSEIGTAVVFGGVYAAVLLAVAATHARFGQLGAYTVAVLSGLTDMDAVTLSTAQLVKAGRLSADSGWRVILAAALSNLGFKLAIVAVLGSRELLGFVARIFAVGLLVGVGLLLGGSLIGL